MSRTIYIKNLDPSITRMMLCKFFSERCGYIMAVRIADTNEKIDPAKMFAGSGAPRFGFIEFVESSSAKKVSQCKAWPAPSHSFRPQRLAAPPLHSRVRLRKQQGQQ